MFEFLISCGVITLAEMGDKTQLLAMAFATCYHWRPVILGIFIATIANHFLAVLAGTYFTNIVSMTTINIVSGISFILFGLWTISGDTLDKDSIKCGSTKPLLTVAVAFFLAEMADKTQLATMALAAKYNLFLPVLMGTTAGMLIADGIGIFIAVQMGKKLPDKLIKWGAALIFIVFGAVSIYYA